MVAVHVDDARIAGNTKWYNEIFPKINNLYKWGSWDEDNYKYTGVTYNGRTGENVAYHLRDYIDKVPDVDLTNLTKLVTDPSQRGDERALNPVGITVFRGVIGALQWITTQGRPDVAGKLATLQKD